MRTLWESNYPVAIRFESAGGVQAGTPVRRNGVSIGRVREVQFSDAEAGVRVVVDIRRQHRLRADAEPQLVRSLLGDASIEFTPGTSDKFLRAGAFIHGRPAADPMEIVNRIEQQMTVTLESFRRTSHEWEGVGRSLNSVMQTNRGHIDDVMERTAEALEQFTLTMRRANAALAHVDHVLGDPQHQQSLKQTLAALPELVNDTRETIQAVGAAVRHVDQNLKNLNEVTTPLAQHSRTMAARLDATLGNVQTVSAELAQFSQKLNAEDGSLKKFVEDPELYRHLNRSAASLTVLLDNLQPIVRDLRIFSDKIARHPELIGVRGALRGSSGLKEPEDRGANGIPPVGGERR
jgi:phospholipid/cholesterol/gamma-HCH transport system substrate-binding protein